MGITYTVSARLKQALAKTATLPLAEQDEIAAMIMARISGDDWAEPRAQHPHEWAAGHFLDTVLPKHPAARTLTLTMGSFILFVQAPMAFLAGVMMVVQAATAEPSGATRVSQLSVGGANHSVVRVPEPKRNPEIAASDANEAHAE